MIVPTFGRRAVLARTLRALCGQTVEARAFEVLVVDDGSADGTYEWLVGPAATAAPRLAALRQDHRGPAAARNLAARGAAGELLLFLGDDMIPSPGLVEAHLRWHAAEGGPLTCLVGRIAWDPALRVTPFMRWLDESQHTFRQTAAELGSPVPFYRFYSGNASVPTHLFRRVGGFDEAFREAAMEDTELGFRLQTAGATLFYAPDALVHHHHPQTFADACRRQAAMGRALPLLVERIPLARGGPGPRASWWASPVRRLLLNDLTAPALSRLAAFTAGRGWWWARSLWRLMLSHENRRWRPPALRTSLRIEPAFARR